MTMSASKIKLFINRCFYRRSQKNTIAIAGFTLLEMMVAVSVMAIALTSVYKLHAQTIRMNSIARFNTIAPLLAQERIALIDSQPIKDASDDSGDFEDDRENYSFNVTIEDNPSEYLETSTDISKNSGLIVKKIMVEITEGEGQQAYKFTTYRMMME